VDTAELFARAAKIKLLLMDVDGVLTEGRIFFAPDAAGHAVETKGFDSQDGISLTWLRWQGIQTGLISGRDSPATLERARQLQMDYIYQGHIEKIPILEEIMAKSGLAQEQIAYVGDDLTDLVVMRRVGLGVAVANARPEVKREAHFVTTHSGGAGAVRETIEMLLHAQGKWAAILAHYGIRET
jgi:3-deoxy-D-manno-octulosonate 8-phosphate phosphatase (KDO 8-P phosphatase)